MDNTRGLIAGVRKELMREDVGEQFRKNWNDTDQITERALEAEDKVNNAKGTNLTTGPLLKESKESWVHTDNSEKYETLGRPKGHAWGKPKRFTVCLNTGKGEVTKGFFPKKFVNSFACKRNYFVLQSESATFSC